VSDLLVAIARKSNTDTSGLKNTNIKTDSHRAIVVDKIFKYIFLKLLIGYTAIVVYFSYNRTFLDGASNCFRSGAKFLSRWNGRYGYIEFFNQFYVLCSN